MNQFTIKNLIRREEREKKKEKKKRILESYQSFNNDIISAVRKISMRQIQQHQDLVYPRVGHMSGPKASEPWHLWIARVTFSVHRLWTSLVLLNLSRRNLSNNTCGIIIRALMCLKYFFFLCFFSFLFSL